MNSTHFAAGSYLVKICGNRFFADSLLVASFRPDFMGWIFSPKSSRRVFPGQAREQIRAIRRLAPGIRHVAVFAGNSIPAIGVVLAEVPELDLIQIVADAGMIASLRELPPLNGAGRVLPIIPVVGVRSPLQDADLLRLGTAPFYLLDSFVEGQPGGTGRRLPVEYLAHLGRPYLLAGGLNPENVVAALAETAAIGADVSSGLEDQGNPGRKNPRKLAAFMAAVRGSRRTGRSA